MSQVHENNVLLLDEDEDFIAALRRAGTSTGLKVDWRRSLFELGSIGKLGAYDALVVEPFIGPVNGLEVAEYVDTFFPGLPVLLVGNGELPFSLARCPRSIVGFASKSKGADEIVKDLWSHIRTRSVGHGHRRCKPLLASRLRLDDLFVAGSDTRSAVMDSSA